MCLCSSYVKAELVEGMSGTHEIKKNKISVNEEVKPKALATLIGRQLLRCWE